MREWFWAAMESVRESRLGPLQKNLAYAEIRRLQMILINAGNY